MNDREYRSLAWTFSMFGLILLVIFSSCSFPFQQTDWRQPPGQTMQRYQITEKDLAQFSESLRIRRQNPETLYRQANYLQRRGKHQLALQLLEEAILADTGFYKAYNAMGVSYDYLRDYPRAVEAYKRALKLNPNLSYVHNNLGYSYLQQGDIDDSINAFKAALAVDSKNVRYHNNLGLAYARKGLYELAFAEFKKAGSETKAHYNMARLYARYGHDAKAQIHLTESLKMHKAKQPLERNLPGLDSFADAANIRPEGMDFRQTVKNGTPQPKHLNNRDENYQVSCGVYSLRKGNRLEEESESNTQRTNGAETGEIEISNGNGVNRMATRVGQYLKKNGLKVTRLTNAAHFGFPTTKIYYRDDYLPEAFDVAKQIPGYQDMEKVDQFRTRNIKVKVLIGRDLIPYDPFFTHQLKGDRFVVAMSNFE